MAKPEPTKPPALFPPHDLWQLARGDYGPPRETPAVLLVRDWIRAGAPERRPWALVMLGDTGVGKSVAAALAWLLLRDEDRAAAQAPGVFADLRGVHWIRARTLQRLSWDQRNETLQRCSAAHGLVVDELGSEDDKTREALLEVIEERGDAKRRTVMTSNLGAEEFRGRYGDRFLDRLRGAGLTKSGKAQWVRVFHGESLRGSDLPTVDEPETLDMGRPASPEFMARELATKAPAVAAMLQPVVEARRAAGRDG